MDFKFKLRLKQEYEDNQAKFPRLWHPCPSFQFQGLHTASQLITTCEFCGIYVARCCSHAHLTADGFPCHQDRVVFTDGACFNNGAIEARSGIGCAPGWSKDHLIHLPVDDEMDDASPRTSQRAELLAAIEGIKALSRIHGDKGGHMSSLPSRDDSEHCEPVGRWIIVSDSEYLVKGMTEWLPTWQAKGMRTGQGRRPANLDLFLRIEEKLEEEEMDKSVKIVFWHVKREFNTVADGLAKKGAAAAVPCGSARLGTNMARPSWY